MLEDMKLLSSGIDLTGLLLTPVDVPSNGIDPERPKLTPQLEHPPLTSAEQGS